MSTSPSIDPRFLTRRSLLRRSSFGLGAVAASWLLKQDGLPGAEPKTHSALEKPELGRTVHDLLPKLPPREPQARAMISMYMLGGPSQIDTFDMKPNAPEAYRSPFQEIATGVPGWKICEHFPELAKRIDRFTLIRTIRTR